MLGRGQALSQYRTNRSISRGSGESLTTPSFGRLIDAGQLAFHALPHGPVGSGQHLVDGIYRPPQLPRDGHGRQSVGIPQPQDLASRLCHLAQTPVQGLGLVGPARFGVGPVGFIRSRTSSARGPTGGGGQGRGPGAGRPAGPRPGHAGRHATGRRVQGGQDDLLINVVGRVDRGRRPPRWPSAHAVAQQHLHDGVALHGHSAPL